jgi:hypothetical protein
MKVTMPMRPALCEPAHLALLVFPRVWRRITACAILSIALNAPVDAQSVNAVVQGKIADTSGAAIPGTVIAASSEETGISRSATSDHAGRYILLDLPPGTYDLRAELSGFAPRVVRHQTLHVGTTITIDYVLNVAGMSESVEVRGNLPARENTKAAVVRVVQRAELEALPVVNRNFNDLAALSPGVTRTGVYGGVDINGSRDFQNAYLLDGVSAKRQRLGDQRMPYAQDWIEEFKVITTQFGPEFGQASGGVLNVITRSGSNQLSGRGYAFLRNDAWDAKPSFATRKPPLDEHRLGGTISGPLVRNRLFYFGGIERFSNDSSNVVNSSFAAANGTVPATDRQLLTIVKIDAVASPTERLGFRFSGQREKTSGAAVGGTSTWEHGGSSKVRTNDVVVSWSSVLSPRLLNEARAGWSTSLPQDSCNFALEHPADPWFELSYPGAQFGCPVNFGSIGEDGFQFVENLSWRVGRHDLKMGGQGFWTRSFGDFRNFRDGRYAFERDAPFAPSDPATYPFSFTRIEGPTAWDFSGWAGGLFVQDSWRFTDDLTLDLGVRYDVDGSWTALNELVRLDKGLHTIGKDVNNVAPRVGAAWTPFEDNRRTIVRGGAGLYYDQHHNNVTTALLLNNILVDRITVINANNPSLNPFWPDIAAAKGFLADALARNRVPDLSFLPGLVGATNDVDAGLRIPRTMQMSGGLVREFTPWLNASADVVYSRGRDLNIIRDTNLDPVTFQRVNRNYSSIATFGNGGWNDYKALQAQLNLVSGPHRLLKAAYTLAGNRSNTASTLSAGTATNPFDYSEDEGPTDNDVRHTVAVSVVTSMKGGLQLSSVGSFRSGLPYSAVTNAPRPDGKPFGFRPEPRNGRRGDDALSLDMRIAKTVAVGRRHAAAAFVELFNLTNESNYANYVGTITSSLFARPTTAGPKRRVQLGFRFDF